MTLEELYARIEGNYSEAVARLRNEKLVARFIVRYLDDPSAEHLATAWEAGDDAGIFQAAHDAKGVCSNLALDALAATASDICEAMRPGNDALRAATDVDALVASFAERYARTRAAIEEFSATA